MTYEKNAKTMALPQKWGSACDDDDERCGCAECLLKFHREMARWFRELVSSQRDKVGLQGSKSKKGMQSCKEIKVELKGKRNKRPVKQGKRDGRRLRSCRERFPRGWMPCSSVIQEICESTLLEPEDVKLVLDGVKDLGTKEVMAGRAFVFPGLAMFKMEKQSRVVSRACGGRAWNGMNVYGITGSRG